MQCNTNSGINDARFCSERPRILVQQRKAGKPFES
jgi:hypothetical protein